MDATIFRRAVLGFGLLSFFAPACGDNRSPTGSPGGSGGSGGGSSDAGGGTSDAPTGDADLGPCQLALSVGRLDGKSMDGTCQFLGIPYAKPPVGALRFAPPAPAEPWQGIRDASMFGPSCMQPMSIVPGMAAMDEDCLSLNIYSPEVAPSAKLPVMVFVHGGGYTLGSSAAYDGRLLSRKGPVVVVTINYRLGALGFFAHPDLDRERVAAPSGSDGIRDQQLALRWVKDNISAFHGDPANVTVFGESAGSGSASLLLVSPASRDLANRFILQSGVSVGTGFGFSSRDQGYALSTSMASALCAGAADPIACLRAKPAQELVGWTSGTTALFGAPWSPVVEGSSGGVLPDTPQNLITSGNYNSAAAIIAGTNKNEWGLFLQPFLGGMPVTTIAQFKTNVAQQFGARAAEVEAQYPVASDAEANDVFIRLMSDMLFRCPTRLLARLTTARGSRFYLYSYEEGPAYHADELAYVFGTASFFGTPPVPALVAVVQGYWTQFAASGDPNAPGLPVWPAYETASDPHVVLENPPAVGSGLSKNDCDFWDRFNP